MALAIELAIDHFRRMPLSIERIACDVLASIGIVAGLSFAAGDWPGRVGLNVGKRLREYRRRNAEG